MSDSRLESILRAPVVNPPPNRPAGFYTVGPKVCYRSGFFLFGDESAEDAPEEVLTTASPIGSNYGEVLSAGEVAARIADLLNRERNAMLHPPAKPTPEPPAAPASPPAESG